MAALVTLKRSASTRIGIWGFRRSKRTASRWSKDWRTPLRAMGPTYGFRFPEGIRVRASLPVSRAVWVYRRSFPPCGALPADGLVAGAAGRVGACWRDLGSGNFQKLGNGSVQLLEFGQNLEGDFVHTRLRSIHLSYSAARGCGSGPYCFKRETMAGSWIFTYDWKTLLAFSLGF